MIIIPMEQGSYEWLQFRRNHIGASDAPVILEMSPWNTPDKLYQEKIHGFDRVENIYMTRGKELEPIARERFEEEIGIPMFPCVGIHPELSWMIASFDGISVKRDYALEIKCPGKKDHGTALKGSIPIKYYPQLQHQIEVCGLDFIYYYSFDGEDGVTLIVQRDDDFIRNMIDKEKEFWDHLQILKKERENAA